ncbi:MAG: PPC domain-containing protein [Verrucomicrobiae bacterium]|nr:PPC domain-containing protein [Verrucomicrobiae bacterium]
MSRSRLFASLIGLAALWVADSALAQLVVLPAPRLLTTMPMGGQAGSTVDVAITGENLEEVSDLVFSTPKITAKPKMGEDGKRIDNQFVVTIAKDTPAGVYDARVKSRLGISAARAFSVGTLPEVTRSQPNQSIETALKLAVNSICNAAMTKRAVDFYSFEGKKGQRVAVDCAAAGIDSKLTPVVIIADAKGSDLLVNRTGGVIDFVPPADGTYLVKVNDLTYQGGERHFYRLALREVAGDGPAPRQPATTRVSAMSWPPAGLAENAAASEKEPNDRGKEAEKVTLPCDLSGRFFPAADVDTYEFEAKKGEVWWVEVASERLGFPTDPFVLVQQVKTEGGKETLADVAELYDIDSPVKVSSNGYSYDGPPYNVGSPDVLGKVEIKEDGRYRLQVRDLFGGTRNAPENAYRLIVRKAAPDFALAAWAVHMTLRNGDRAAFSKPIALRAGGAMVLEVLVVRRDGFDGEIELAMDGLPAGVSASGLKIPAGKSVGHIVVSADPKAKRADALAKISGRATIDGKPVTRPCRLASMEWPVKDAKQEIPSPRLYDDVPVSVTDAEPSPLTITAAENKVWEAKAGETLKIPLKAEWRGDFSGTSIKLKAYGSGFEGMKEFEVPVKTTAAEAVLDLAALKTPPGDYTIALYGSAVAKYSYNPEAVKAAEEAKKKAEAEAAAAAEEAKKLAADAANAPADQKPKMTAAAKEATEKQKEAEAVMAKADKEVKAATAAAAPKDIVDIYVSAPIRVSVKPADAAVATNEKK